MGSPTTVIARWPVANAQSAIPILARVIRDNLGGVGTGRRAIQIRPFRLPGSQSGSGKGSGSTRTDKIMGDKKAPDDGRNLYVVRCVTNSNAEEQVMVFVEDPVAPLRKLDDGDATPTLRLDSMMDVVESAPPPSDEPKPSHTRWTYCQLGGSPRPTAGPSHATPFDAFLQRVLLGPGTSSAGSSSNVGSWIPRSTAISVEGFVFASGGTAGSMGDWEINVGSISVKGGAAGGNSRGVLVEVSPFVREEYVRDSHRFSLVQRRLRSWQFRTSPMAPPTSRTSSPPSSRLQRLLPAKSNGSLCPTRTFTKHDS